MQHFVGLWHDYLLPHSEPSPGRKLMGLGGLPTNVRVCVVLVYPKMLFSQTLLHHTIAR